MWTSDTGLGMLVKTHRTRVLVVRVLCKNFGQQRVAGVSAERLRIACSRAVCDECDKGAGECSCACMTGCPLAASWHCILQCCVSAGVNERQ